MKIEKKVGTVAIVFIDERDYAFLIRALLGYVSFWLILIFLFATQISWAAMQPLPDAVLGSFALWTPWILVSPLMLLMGYLLPPGGVGIWKFIVGHVVACAVLLASFFLVKVDAQTDLSPGGGLVAVLTVCAALAAVRRRLRSWSAASSGSCC